MNDNYVNSLIVQDTPLKHSDIPQQYVELQRIILKTKSGKLRELPIDNALYFALSNLENIGIEYVFINKKGKLYKDVKRSFQSACARAKITDFVFHDLRHTFASHLALAGVGIRVIQELLGHKSLVMTMRYANLSNNHMMDAVNILDGKLSDAHCTAHRNIKEVL